MPKTTKTYENESLQLSVDEIKQLKADISGYSTVLEMPVELQLRLMNYYMESFEYVDIDGVMVSVVRQKTAAKSANEKAKYDAEYPLAKELSSLGLSVYLFPENDKAIIYQRRISDGAIGRAWLELKTATTKTSIKDAVRKGLAKCNILFLNIIRIPPRTALKAITDQINGSKDSIKYKDKLIVIGINGKMEFAVKTNIKGLEQALGGGPRRITSLPDIHDSITSLFVNNQAK